MCFLTELTDTTCASGGRTSHKQMCRKLAVQDFTGSYQHQQTALPSLIQLPMYTYSPLVKG